MANTTIQLGDVTLDVAARLIRALGIGPERPENTWRASVGWRSGFSAAAAIALEVDLADPKESLLDALGTCVSIGLATDAALADEPIDDLRIDLAGALDLRRVAEEAAGDPVAAFVTLGLAPCTETVAEVRRRAG